MKPSHSDRVHLSHLCRGGSVGHLRFLGVRLLALPLLFVLTCLSGGHTFCDGHIQTACTKKNEEEEISCCEAVKHRRMFSRL